MDLTGRLKSGMRIVGPDQTEYGTVERCDDISVYVGGRPIPYDAFERLDRDRLYVGRGGARYFQADRGARTVAQEGEVRVPLVEERLAVDTRTVELGHLEVGKTIESERVSVPVELRRDQVEVRQVDTEERPITILEGMDAFKEEAIHVPVRGEEVAVSKEAVVTGDVTVGREQIAERHTISEPLRQEVVDVTVSKGEARQDLRGHLDQLQSRLREAGGPTFRARDLADADPVYRAGSEARDVPRHADGSSEDVELELQEHPGAGDAPHERDEVLRVPEVEEHLRVERRRIALGFVEVRKTVITERVMVPVELRREVVEYRLIDDPGGVATIGETPGDLKDDTVRIPVFRERPVVHKETVVASEVVIERTLITDEQTLNETLRRLTVTVDEDLDRDGPPAYLKRARTLTDIDSPLKSDRGATGHPVRVKDSESGGRSSTNATDS
jgi:uncharacterized protein (TIGR02271 family)